MEIQLPEYIIKHHEPFDVSEIIEGKLWLGNHFSAAHLDKLKIIGITHIVVAAITCKMWFIDDFKYLKVDLVDSPNEVILTHVPNVIQFIDNAIESGGKVLVHCIGGISRSSSLVIAYVMKSRSLTYADAFSFVQQRRSIVRPNNGFVRQLELFEGMKYNIQGKSEFHQEFKKLYKEAIKRKKNAGYKDSCAIS